ncbi:NF-kappa-B inhibitor cactus-like isoform X2 [Dreissena polymorpha]|uniref:NF-kappa-B inhibitor cactus-like isoform X2 n=1 Tax=Dreissena polymorpha TaxID=45954 RepID=UPI002264C9F0|nr:NF-kappa-B inhibitor cactus-like isoform X2 [Dreissena polymorpha]XP_052277598.1 NF-kappa-B inhibitor cactus-like isoform X2 [Dreissena polymorpha]
MTLTGTDGNVVNQNDHGHNNRCPQRSDMDERVGYHIKRKYRRTSSVALLIPEDVGFLRTDESPTREVPTNTFFKYPSLTSLCDDLDSCELSDLQFSGIQESNSMHISNVRCAQDVACNSEDLFVKDEDGDTALHLAIILEYLLLVSKIIQMAPTYTYLSMRNKLFQTPLHLAVIMNQKHIVRKLVCAGADVTAVDRNGNTPLHIACRDGLYEIARYLLEPVRYSEIQCNPYDIPYQKIPQDFDIANYDGLTCLHLAVMNGHMDILQLLIERDVDLNMIERKAGTTVLHMACISGDVKLVRTLMSVRACNMDARTYSGYTTLDLALCYHQDGVYTILAAAGAKPGAESMDSDSD